MLKNQWGRKKLRQRWYRCQTLIIWNFSNICSRYDAENNDAENKQSMNNVQDDEWIYEENNNDDRNFNKNSRRRANEISCKGIIDNFQDEWIVRFFH